MPISEYIKKVLVIGSGPIIIGQAAEFDYSGTQACKALREEGIEVILVNSNPATIMTDLDVADNIYIEPLTMESLTKIIDIERPHGILATLGGQTALNVATDLYKDGVLTQYNVHFLGTSIGSIQLAEDRKLFKSTMKKIGQRVANSKIATTLEEGTDFIAQVGFPVIIRPAYTLGGTGGGTAHNMNEFIHICTRGLKSSPIHQVLIEESVAGWKEIELEIVRDNEGNSLVVCSMENLDPVGVHTGDSIVVAPTQTLSPSQLSTLRKGAFSIVEALDIKGGCNVQFALNPDTGEYIVIEVNPRVSRSSALASKATGYPIARVASKIALGVNLDEIEGASIEPTLDYVIVKVPRWPFDKFTTADRRLGTQMKATGEVMAIGATFEEALLKAIDSLDIKLNFHIGMNEIGKWDNSFILDSLRRPDDERIFAISEALNRGYTVENIHNITKIDKFFIEKLKYINIVADKVKSKGTLTPSLLLEAKKCGLSDTYIGKLIGRDGKDIASFRRENNILPSYKSIDNKRAYYYSTYEDRYGSKSSNGSKKVIVLGSGPIRIGQGIEFDYCSVHSVKALREKNMEAIIINSNPETVSTDFDTADTLYFEPLTLECVLDVVDRENPLGVIVQFGGQTAINLATPLKNAGVNILGTTESDINRAEDRELFLNLLNSLNIPTPEGGCAKTHEEALNIVKSIGYPVIVRPSYVLGGRAMEIVYSDSELIAYLDKAIKISDEHNVLIDRYIMGKEVEIDGICDGQDVVIPGIMEHIEKSGIHSGDSIGLYPPQTLSDKVKHQILNYSVAIARNLNIKGLFNIQFVVDEHENVYVIEVNPRASRTVPFMSKATGLPIVSVATHIMLGQTLKDMGYNTGILTESSFIAVKAPVFSFAKLSRVDPFLGPEMKSTGEVMGIGNTLDEALYKALISANIILPQSGNILLSITDREKSEALKLAKELIDMGYNLYATEGTYSYLSPKLGAIHLLTKKEAPICIRDETIHMVINMPTNGQDPSTDGFLIRRTAMEFDIPCITCLSTAIWALRAIKTIRDKNNIHPLNNHNRSNTNVFHLKS